MPGSPEQPHRSQNNIAASPTRIQLGFRANATAPTRSIRSDEPVARTGEVLVEQDGAELPEAVRQISGGVLLLEQSGPEAGEAGARELAVECVQDGVALDVAELGRQRPDGEGALDPFGGVEQAVVAEAPDELDGVESSHGDARQVDVVSPVHADTGLPVWRRIETPSSVLGRSGRARP